MASVDLGVPLLSTEALDIHHGEAEHLHVDAPVVGPVADDPEHRPRDAPALAHVGDLRRTDVAGARAAGMRSVRYRGLHDDRGDGPDADVVISEWHELLDLVDLGAQATEQRGGVRS